MKSAKGITLVALVVTIIILIILAGVSITLVLGENGIITRAKQSKTITEESQLNEQAKLNEIVEYMENNLEISKTTTSILKAGDYIKYNTGVASVGNNGVITCRVLYEASSAYGLQIISDKNVADVTLGGSDWTTAKNSCNNAIVTLNNEAEKYINTAYVTDARCVGSVPTINTNGIFIEKDKETKTTVVLPLSNWSSYTRPSGWTSNDTGCFDEDVNYITDETQMKNKNIWTTGEIYWLATRSKYSDSSHGSIYIQISNTTGVDYSPTMCYINSSGYTTGKLHSLGLRPCFALKSNIIITGGDGTSEATAYTM